MTQWIRYETHVGDPINTQTATLIPFAKALEIRFPGNSGGFIVNRPTSVLVAEKNGREENLSIRNVTRIAIWSIYGISALVVLLTWLFKPSRE